MARRSLGQLTLDLLVKMGSFERDVRKARSTTDQLTAMAARSFKRMAAAVGVAVTAMGAAFAYQVRQQINFADEVGKMSARVGVSTEALSTLAFVAGQSGTSLEALETGLTRLARNMSDAERGLSTAVDAFEMLNIQWRDADGNLRDQEQLLLEVADRFAQLEDGAEKTAAATMLFGRSGAELIPMLNQGAAGIDRLRERARELGLEIGGQTAAAAAELNDNIDELQSALIGLARDVATDAVPAMNRTVEVMLEAQRESGILAAVFFGLGAAFREAFTDGDDSLREMMNQADRARRHIVAFEDALTDDPGNDRARQHLAHWREQLEQVENRIVSLQDREAEAAAEFERQVADRARSQREATDALRQEAEERDRLRQAAQEQQALEEAAAAAVRADTEARRQAVAAVLDGLQMQADTLGLTTEQLVLYQLGQQGATAADLERAAALQALVGKYDANEEHTRRMIAAQAEAKTAEASRRQAIQTVIDGLEEQADTLGMTSEQILIYRLRQQGATEADIARAVAMQEIISKYNAQEEAAREAGDAHNQFADQAARNMQDVVAAFLRGEDAVDSFRSALANMLSEFAASQLLQSLFSGFTEQDGFLGDFARSIVGSRKGGRASGGPVMAGSIYEVNERGVPEIATVGGRDYLLMGSQGGKVKNVGGGVVINNHISVPANVDPRGFVQLAEALKREIMNSTETRLQHGYWN